METISLHNVGNMCTDANRTLGFLRQNIYPSPEDAKEAAYKGLVRPVLKYGIVLFGIHKV